MRALLACTIVALVAACTIQESVPQPVITIDCVLVELPGGEVRTDCDAGADAAAD